MLDLRSPFGFRSLPYMLSPVVPRSSNRAPGLPPYPAAALKPEADPPKDIRDESVTVEPQPDGLDADAVEHERMMRLERWQRQR